jgi:hypothetical protein
MEQSLNDRHSVNYARIAMELGAGFRGESQLPFTLLFGPIEHPLEKELTLFFSLCPGGPHATIFERLGSVNSDRVVMKICAVGTSGY